MDHLKTEYRQHRALNIEGAKPVIGYPWIDSNHAYIMPYTSGIQYDTNKCMLTAPAVEVHRETIAISMLFADDNGRQLFEGDTVCIGDDIFVLKINNPVVLGKLSSSKRKRYGLRLVRPNYADFEAALKETAVKEETAKETVRPKLIVMEQESNWYIGYENNNGQYGSLFTIHGDKLFSFFQDYLNKGYLISLSDKICAVEMINDYLNSINKVVLWRYDTSSYPSALAFGKTKPKPIKTKVILSEHSSLKIEPLGRGFFGIAIKNSSAYGVYELISGGLVGDTIVEVMRDIDRCNNPDVMYKQVEDAARICKMEAKMVSNKEFGIGKEEK